MLCTRGNRCQVRWVLMGATIGLELPAESLACMGELARLKRAWVLLWSMRPEGVLSSPVGTAVGPESGPTQRRWAMPVMGVSARWSCEGGRR